MRGYPFRDQQIIQKAARLPSGQYVEVDTAVNVDSEKTVLVSEASLARAGVVWNAPILTLIFDGQNYNYTRSDTANAKHVYTIAPKLADVDEGKERINKNTVENWPIGGDKPQVDDVAERLRTGGIVQV